MAPRGFCRLPTAADAATPLRRRCVLLLDAATTETLDGSSSKVAAKGATNCSEYEGNYHIVIVGCAIIQGGNTGIRTACTIYYELATIRRHLFCFYFYFSGCVTPAAAVGHTAA